MLGRTGAGGAGLLSPGGPHYPGDTVLHRLFKWTMSLAAHPRAKLALALVAFAESSFFPVPPDVMLVPMVLAERRRAFLIATICLVASVLGGIAGYLIGALAFDAIGHPLIKFYGAGDHFEHFRAWYSEWGLLIVFAAGLTPLPYKVFTIASGFAALNPVVFIAGSIFSRGIRFYAEAALLWFFGKSIRNFVEKHLQLVSIVFLALLLGGFVLVRLML